jgi:hypothetical protein
MYSFMVAQETSFGYSTAKGVRMAYEVFERTSARVEEPTITLRSEGRIAINAAAVRILKQVGIKNVLLLWDRSHRKIALKAAQKAETNAYAVSFTGNHSGIVRGKAFLEHIGWTTSQSQMFPATWNEKEKMLEITLPPQNAEHKKTPRPDHKGVG